MLYNKLIISINKLNKLFPNTPLLLSNTNMLKFSLNILSTSDYLFIYDNNSSENTCKDLNFSLNKNIILIKEDSNYTLIGRLKTLNNKNILAQSNYHLKDKFFKMHTYPLEDQLQVIENLLSFYIFSPRSVEDIYILSKSSPNFDVYKYN